MSTPEPNPPRKPPGFLARLFVVVFGAGMLLTARALIVGVGGVIGIMLGILTGVVGLAVVAIGSGLVEWWVQRQRGG